MIVYIGKEANRLEEQSYLGIDPDMEIAYGMAREDRELMMAEIRQAVERHGPVAVAKAAGVSRQHLNAIVRGDAIPSDALLSRLGRTTMTLELAEDADAREAGMLFARIKASGVRSCAALAGIDAGHLTRLVSGERTVTKPIFERLKRALTIDDQRITFRS